MRSLVPTSFINHIRWLSAESRSKTWLRELDHLANLLLDEWSLHLDGETMHGDNGIAIPVLRDHHQYILKLEEPSTEFENQLTSLLEWNGRGMVRLYGADASRGAMLVERLSPGFSDVDPPLSMVRTTARLLREEAIPSRTPFKTTRASAIDILFSLRNCALTGTRTGPVSSAQFDKAIQYATAISETPIPDSLVNADLHYEQVLRRSDGAWCGIDPRPMIGHNELQCAQLLWTIADRLEDAAAIRRAFEVIVAEARLDPGLAHMWTIARATDYCFWGLRHNLTTDPAACVRVLDALLP